jgi:capsule polysaccharide export protein KpsC/LpsZ
VTGLLAVSSKAIPLLIYATTANQPREPRRVRRIRDEILQIMADLEMLQPYLTSSTRNPIKLESLLAILAEIITMYSEIESILSKLRGKAGRLLQKLEGMFSRGRILSITQRLSCY